jgi:hypothetical protein
MGRSVSRRARTVLHKQEVDWILKQRIHEREDKRPQEHLDQTSHAVNIPQRGVSRTVRCESTLVYLQLLQFNHLVFSTQSQQLAEFYQEYLQLFRPRQPISAFRSFHQNKLAE